MGAVYMGALTYIGNAPNLMVYAIAEERGVKMPSFFGYMLWAALVLLPVLGADHFRFRSAEALRDARAATCLRAACAAALARAAAGSTATASTSSNAPSRAKLGDRRASCWPALLRRQIAVAHLAEDRQVRRCR